MCPVRTGNQGNRAAGARFEAEKSRVSPASRPGDSLDFTQRLVQIGKVPKPVADEHAIERSVREGKAKRIAADRLFQAASPREHEHALGQIHRDGAGAWVLLSHEYGEIAR